MEEIDVKYLNGENFYKITDINGKIIQDLTNYNGLVKEYYEDNWLIFEGEFLSGKRNGIKRNNKRINNKNRFF